MSLVGLRYIRDHSGFRHEESFRVALNFDAVCGSLTAIQECVQVLHHRLR